MLRSKDLLGLKELTADEIEEIISLAFDMKRVLKTRQTVSDLSGKSVVTLFYENSTRTRNSFDTASRFLSARTSTITASASSVTKGESLIDTGKTLDALMTDIIVIRHSMSGAPHLLAKNVRASVINAGDGMNEHPTQALLDLYTMKEKFGSIKGLKVVLVGDIKHSRVARSNIWGLRKLGASVTVVAPNTLLPAGIESLGCTVVPDLEVAAKDANVIMGLRLQLERQKSGLFPSISEYSKMFEITSEKIAGASSDLLIMHPGPINRDIEICGEIADGACSVINEQVTNGVAVRMAVMKLLGGKK